MASVADEKMEYILTGWRASTVESCAYRVRQKYQNYSKSLVLLLFIQHFICKYCTEKTLILSFKVSYVLQNGFSTFNVSFKVQPFITVFRQST